ncbi:23S rRNA (guanosine(2251)-2'-O)-methyltransferase RlmB [Asaia lannensis]|uniref:23S rRNA (Guanosine(2251)-2'-O)-methyltransferase RlmB n=1 Tax=Asaia lannensis NBRC 102526 TaxID=1307926 RepID=A0ABT1CDC1_9PROT|nr:23S rRNA (guanosine(2251)-2'-O)-methyltransferase RlmB [Asaia lannensis]MCO6158862.1 23S rRNA (guanosine(2251)-2'-O)-methyltransferase RlmB [Asaia lannensis NBRC 102526]
MSRRPSRSSASSSSPAQEGRTLGKRNAEGHSGGGRSGGGRSTASGYWMYGLHAVEAALRNADRQVHELLATREALSALEARQVPTRISPNVVERQRLDHLCERDAVHQGICLRVEPLTPPFLDEVLDRREGPLLILDQVTDPRNIGAILRSAAAFGAAALVVQDRNTPQEGGALAKAASGALDAVPILREVNLSRIIAQLQNAGLWTVGLDAGGSVLNGPSYTGRRVALVLGAEGAGLRRLTRESCDEIASVYMPGDMESLNVSNAAAVALYELVRPA